LNGSHFFSSFTLLLSSQQPQRQKATHHQSQQPPTTTTDKAQHQAKPRPHKSQILGQIKQQTTMKVPPPILLLTTAKAFTAPRRHHSPLHHGLNEQSPVKDIPSSAATETDTPLPGMNVDAAFNIGGMPTALDENTKKKQIAKVRLWMLDV
jgi:hypothetical protein